MPAAGPEALPAGSATAQRASGLPRGPADAPKDGPPHDRKWVLNIKHAGHLMTSDFTLKLLVDKGVLLDLPADQIRQLIQECTTDPYTGGEAAVHITRWNGHGNAIPKDTPIAIKVYCHPDFKAQDPREWNEDDHRDQVFWCQSLLRQEVNILGILHDTDCANSFPCVLGIFQHPGSLRGLIPPTFGYVMPAYKYGSLAEFLHRTCHRLPDSNFAAFFAPAQLAGHYSKLHKVLLRLSTAEAPPHPAGAAEGDAATPQPNQAASAAAPRRGLLLQDISSNNLLLRETGQGCELLFADPSRAQLAAHMEHSDAKRFIAATFLWGCMASYHGIVDETADVHSTNICMLEVWGVAEGAPVPLKELASWLRADSNIVVGVTLLRALCTAMLKRHAMGAGTCGIVPRTRRELPLSWLMLWAILLGCDDFHSKQELDSGRHHRRPSVADMADVSARLAAVAEQMEGLEGGVTAAALESPAGAALVQCCVQLYDRLAALTRLDDPDLLPADASLRWVATRFLQQDHPLVAAMKRQGALPLGKEDERAIDKLSRRMCTFQAAVLEAECEAVWIGDERLVDQLVDVETHKLRLMCKEYRQCQLEVLRLVPQDSAAARLLRSRLLPPELQPLMEGLLPLPPATEPQQAASSADPAAAGAEPQAARVAVPPPAAMPQPHPPPAVAAAAPQPSLAPAAPDMQPSQPWAVAAVQQIAVPAVAPLASQQQQPCGPTAAPASQLGLPQPLLPLTAAVQQAAPVPDRLVALVHGSASAAVPQLMPTPAAPAAQQGAQLPPQAAVQWASPPPVAELQLAQAAAGQSTPGSQTCFSLLPHQQLLGGQAPGGMPSALPSSPGPPAPAASTSPAAPGGTRPAQRSLGFDFGSSPRMDPCAAAPSTKPAAGWTAPGAHTEWAAGVAAVDTSPGGRAQAPAACLVAASAAALGGPLESPTKKRRLDVIGNAALKPHAFCSLFAAPGPAAPGQSALPPAPVPKWLRLLREQGPLAAAFELSRLGASGPSSSTAAASTAAASSAAASPAGGPACSPALSSEGRRHAPPLAGGLSLQPDPNRNSKKADVEGSANAPERLLTSQLPPAGL